MSPLRIDAVMDFLREHNCVTGSDLSKQFTSDVFELWRTCTMSDELHLRVIGQRYLRLDKEVEGFARLSPSIMREFLTYTLIGRAEDEKYLALKGLEREEKISTISSLKRELAFNTMAECVSELLEADLILEKHVFYYRGRCGF